MESNSQPGIRISPHNDNDGVMCSGFVTLSDNCQWQDSWFISLQNPWNNVTSIIHRIYYSISESRQNKRRWVQSLQLILALQIACKIPHSVMKKSKFLQPGSWKSWGKPKGYPLPVCDSMQEDSDWSMYSQETLWLANIFPPLFSRC